MNGYERLSALDSSFLLLETPEVHQHIGSVMIYDAGPLQNEAGGVDFEKICRFIEASLEHIPSYRKRAVKVPASYQRVWLDDENFDFSYHVRHVALPAPGDAAALKATTSRILSQPLDPTRPLWETYVIEGLEGNRFALVSKLHHCMIDGSSGANMMALLHRIDPDATIGKVREWTPQSSPSKLELKRSAFKRRIVEQPKALLDGVRRIRKDVKGTLKKTQRITKGMAEAVQGGAFDSASPAPWNNPLSPERSLEYFAIDLEKIKEVKNTLGGTVNDVTVAITAGALRRYLQRHDYDVDNMVSRTTIPVSVRSDDDETLGNKVAALMIKMPINKERVIDRYKSIVYETSHLKNSNLVYAVTFMEKFADQTLAQFFTVPAQISFDRCASNLVVTNVRGPNFPLYMLGARLYEGFTILALSERQGLGVSVFSYDNKLLWGITADRQQVPDLAELREDFEIEWETLRKLAEMKLK